MKKAVAVFLACLFAIFSAACGANGGANPSGSPDAPVSQSPPPETDSPSGSSPDAPGGESAEPSPGGGDYGPFASAKASDGIGFFSPDFDYSVMPEYEIAFLSMTWSSQLEQLSNAFEQFAERTNVKYTHWDSGNDVDAMMVNIETQASQGIDGCILGIFVTDCERAAEIAEDNDLFWMPGTDAPRDSQNKLLAPFVGFDNYNWGDSLIRRADEWCVENFTDYEPSTSRVLILTYSANVEFNDRQAGMEAGWAEMYPDLTDNLYVCDTASQGNVSPDGAYDLVSTQMAAHPDVSSWIILSVFDWIAPGAQRAAEQYGVVDKTCLATTGGDQYVQQLREGEAGCWRLSLFEDFSTAANARFNGLYALIAGWAAPDTLWSDFIQPGERCANLYLASAEVNPDNFRQILAYSDYFNGFSLYPECQWDGKTTFPVVLGQQ
ncbi:MAG: substrate-binding domain-containing protein [Oscillospiraceae bacterium]|jgi:ABC-type sugar transport system substrate-binding protein|nr:substrate-binding domain-containing protein [Oscillospiraceae bacterium]